MTVTTRITYALVRDRALPGSHWMNKLNPETHNPDRVLLVVLVLDAVLCLLPLFSTTAFGAITQITTIGFQLSYAIPIGLRLYLQLCQPARVLVGPFNLGRWSSACAFFSLIWLAVTSAVLFFPQKIDPVLGVTVENFNYTGVVVLGSLLWAAAYWYLPEAAGGARHHFKGPIALVHPHLSKDVEDFDDDNGEEVGTAIN